VALWSDLDDLEELEFEFAMKDIRSDASIGIREVPGALLFCVFGLVGSTRGAGNESTLRVSNNYHNRF